MFSSQSDLSDSINQSIDACILLTSRMEPESPFKSRAVEFHGVILNDEITEWGIVFVSRCGAIHLNSAQFIVPSALLVDLCPFQVKEYPDEFHALLITLESQIQVREMEFHNLVSLTDKGVNEAIRLRVRTFPGQRVLPEVRGSEDALWSCSALVHDAFTGYWRGWWNNYKLL